MSEKVLTLEVQKLRREQVTETKEKAPETTEQVAIAPKTPLEQNYYNLMQLIVRYGERPIEVDGTMYSVGEIIIYTLENDGVAAPQPIYQTLIDEFKAHSKDEGFKAQPFFTFHSNPQLCALAVEMIAEKYQFVKPEQEARLGELVAQLLYEIKLTVVNMQIDSLEDRIKQAQAAGDVNTQLQLLGQQPQLIAMRNELCKVLGNRVINV